jgi:hypothetical protein
MGHHWLRQCDREKSGPAFNKVENSRLVAVMRRDATKAENYAQRHGVPKWYDDANKLINDPEINSPFILFFFISCAYYNQPLTCHKPGNWPPSYLQILPDIQP